MNERCSRIRELLPDHVAKRRPPGAGRTDEGVVLHLRSCPACAREARLLEELLATRRRAPEGLADRVLAALEDGSGGLGPEPYDPGEGPTPVGGARRGAAPGFPWWGLAAAAVAAVALGIGLEAPDPGPGAGDAPVFVESPGGLWLSGDGEVAGVPALDGLTDEELEALLEGLGDGLLDDPQDGGVA